MTCTLVWVKIPKLCHKCPTISLFSWEREGILTPQTLCKAVIASVLSDLISPARTKLDKASMSAPQNCPKICKLCIFFSQISHLSSNRREQNSAHLFQFKTPARKLTHKMKFEHFCMQKDTNFGNTIIIHHFRPENPLNPTQKDTNFGNTIIFCHFGPENPQNPTQKDRNFEKMHSLTSAKMPTNKESIHFSRILHFLHHNSNAPINLIQHQPTNHFFWEHLVTHFSNFADQL